MPVLRKLGILDATAKVFWSLATALLATALLAITLLGLPVDRWLRRSPRKG